MPAAALPIKKKKILLVDDDVAATEAIAQLLSNDFDVITAHDGFEGYELAVAVPGPDLIIADVEMPGMLGTTMVERIRAKRRVPVIFLTALGGPLDVVRGIQAGARHYLTKPVNIDELEAKIERALGTRSTMPPPI